MKSINRVWTVAVLLLFCGGLALAISLPASRLTLAQSADPVLVGAGDIANCNRTEDESTAQLLDGIAGTVFTLGDNAYPDGTLSQFQDCYEPAWGRHKDRTRPAAGNHDYHTAGAEGYYTFFGPAASPLDINCTRDCRGYYSYELGEWHIIALNSEIDHSAGSEQEQWLRADLAANQSICTLAYWHKPRFSSGLHGNYTGVQPIWQALYEYQADVVLNAHDHTYERFAPQNPNGQADPIRGIREFVVGTGGARLYPFPSIQPNSEVRSNTTWGVLKLTLYPGSYDWEFLPIAGQTFTDSGIADCIGAEPTPTATQWATDAPTATSTPTSTGTPAPSPTFTPTATSTPDAGVLIHIGDLDGRLSSQGGQLNTEVTARVHDAGHSPVANATVGGIWSIHASCTASCVIGTASCITGSDGQCTLNISDLPFGTKSVIFTVTEVAHASLIYDEDNNHDPDGDSNGTRIIVLVR